MYKRILIITDNLPLANRFNELLQNHAYNAEWAFAVSPFSDVNLFQNQLNQVVFSYDLRVDTIVDQLIAEFDLIFSIHCKQIFPATLVNAVKCINIHPGYNPINRGWYPQVFAILKDLPIGATIHEMDEKLDHGKIIARGFIEKNSYDTSETLYAKILDKEIELLGKNLDSIIAGDYSSYAPEEEGNLYLKKDFNDLTQFDLNKQMTGHEFINLLRAMTHGKYSNLYFIDPESNKKVFIKIDLKVQHA
jgi:methionyl-tRNA formyltransferase